ncbi:trypsin-like serine peptidase [Enhygromyxa salina]|uniref:Serine protease n=1 Tax=Enhygromyxa salina TaxID=215803 RepID=A0A2S9Y7X1_9BACT|nr:serine protease [Enhygromyxa salina]PRQ01116.1 Serine protease SplB precursor [Enhygromyxa salina]
MGPRQIVGLRPNESRLGELGPRTQALVEAAASEPRDTWAPASASPGERAQDHAPQRTVDGDNFLPSWFLRVGSERARSVARIEIFDGGKTYFGTGFMVSPSLLMTNHHVLPRLAVARGARVFFDFEDDEHGRQLSPQVFVPQPDRYLFGDPILDFALVAIEGDPGARWGTIPLRHAATGVEVDARVNLIQHPRGGRKQVVIQGNHITKVVKSAIHYLADTEGGSSGSPVFNARWELVALHHCGGARDNVGVRTDVILKLLTVAGSQRGASPLLRELLDGVAGSGDFGLFATTGLTPPSPEASDRELPSARTVLDWMGGAEFLDPGHWDLGALFSGLSGGLSGGLSAEQHQPKLDAITRAVVEAGADFMVLEGIPGPLRAALGRTLGQAGLGVVELGRHALLCLDAAVDAQPCDLDPISTQLASSVCNGRRVLPEGFVRLQITLARSGAASTRALYLLFVELDAGRDLPSRAHRNELARVLGELALASGRDVVVLGLLAGVLDRPGLSELVAPPELTIMAAPPRAGDDHDVGAIAWIGDGLGADLEHVYCWPDVRTLRLDPKVERHEFDRRVELGPELSAAGAPLLLRGRFGELERNPAPIIDEPQSRELIVNGYVRSIVVTNS